MGIETIGHLQTVSLDRLIERFGHWGRNLHAFARGEDSREVHLNHVRKSLSTEHTFEQNIVAADEIDEVLNGMADEVARGLDKRGLSSCTVTVKARYPDFTTVTRSHTLPVPTAASDVIAACCRELIRSTEAFERSVRLLGVGASNLVPGSHEQLALFDLDRPPEKTAP
jgi:DNA polymerase-4